MGSVYEVKVTGTHRLNGRRTSETYLIDLGQAARMGDAEHRARHEAKQKAYSDGISPESVTARRTSDYGHCPHCGDPVSPDQLK